MYQKIYKYLVAFIMLLPITCFAIDLGLPKKTIYYDEAKIKFEMDEEAWTEEPLSKDRQIVDRKWIDCQGSVLTTGLYDIYGMLSSEEKKDFLRESFNYENVLKTNDDALIILNNFKDVYPIDNWRYVNEKMRFIEIKGTTVESGISVDYDIYFTVNNGYIFMFQFMRSINLPSNIICYNSVSDLVATAESSLPKKRMENFMSDYSLIFKISMGILLTLIMYEIYPFIRVILMKKNYQFFEVRRMALWNSVVVCSICLIAALLLGVNVPVNFAPAYIYYLINKKIWLNKGEIKVSENDEHLSKKANEKTTEIISKKSNNQKKNSQKQTSTFICSECGAVVKDGDDKCPKCGESFNEGIADNNVKIDIDKMTSDLNKLKKLLDDGVLTQEEFNAKKKIVLNKYK